MYFPPHKSTLVKQNSITSVWTDTICFVIIRTLRTSAIQNVYTHVCTCIKGDAVVTYNCSMLPHTLRTALKSRSIERNTSKQENPIRLPNPCTLNAASYLPLETGGEGGGSGAIFLGHFQEIIHHFTSTPQESSTWNCIHHWGWLP